MLTRTPGLEPQTGPELGFRSKFVLAKIGHDLRACYDDLVSEPLPDPIGRALRQLDGLQPKDERREESRPQ